MAEAWQLLLSLLAIAALVLVVRHLKLGDGAALQSKDDALRAADVALDGYAATDVAVSSCRTAAILIDADQRILILRQHGSHFAGRLLDAQTSAHLQGETLTIATADRRFDSVALTIPHSERWKARVDALKQRSHA